MGIEIRRMRREFEEGVRGFGCNFEEGFGCILCFLSIYF